jgi:hypothetical protein
VSRARGLALQSLALQSLSQRFAAVFTTCAAQWAAALEEVIPAVRAALKSY